MIEKIVIFKGSRKDFDGLLKDRVSEGEETVTFLELIKIYNARLRPNESGVAENALSNQISADICIVKAEDYGSVLEHFLSNFANAISLNYDIGTLYLQNPPKRVISSLETYDDIEYVSSEYEEITRESLKRVYQNLNKDILGQEKCKKQIISGLYKLISLRRSKPIVLMFYGPSGVGKTETAKSISRSLGGELLRIQFSMMQTGEAYNYIFGAEHSKGSFARDMLGRESDVILIDEFDKVNPSFYNAFYELFDEGKYVDTTYEVELKNTIFLCTCNFMSEKEIKTILGPAMYSRIGCCIEYGELSLGEKQMIINDSYNEILNELKEDEQKLIEESGILQWFNENVERYDNIRLLKTRLENAIFDELAETFIISEANA